MSFLPVNNTTDINSNKIFISPLEEDIDNNTTVIQGVWINPLVEEIIWHYNYFNGKRTVNGYSIIFKKK